MECWYIFATVTETVRLITISNGLWDGCAGSHEKLRIDRDTLPSENSRRTSAFRGPCSDLHKARNRQEEPKIITTTCSDHDVVNASGQTSTSSWFIPFNTNVSLRGRLHKCLLSELQFSLLYYSKLHAADSLRTCVRGHPPAPSINICSLRSKTVWSGVCFIFELWFKMKLTILCTICE
jgi:hypothetical protein